jgi:CrcB protein
VDNGWCAAVQLLCVLCALSASGLERQKMHKYLLVGLGGFAGAIARYGLGTLVTQRMGLRFPYGTFLINVSGCFLIGFFMHLLAERGVLDLHWLYIVVIGFIGAYTTFSTFEYETMRELQDGQIGIGLLYVGSSVLGGFFMVWLGSVTAKLVP